MDVRVFNKIGKRLMNCSPRKARLLLKNNKAEVIGKNPFTIKLKYGSSGYAQEYDNREMQCKSRKTCKLRTSQVFNIARKYYTAFYKQQLIRKVFKLSRRDGIEYMAQLTGESTEYIYSLGSIEMFKKARNRIRRGRSRVRFNKIDNEEASMVASQLAGGGKLSATGGKRTVHKNGSGNVRSAMSEQVWQAMVGN